MNNDFFKAEERSGYYVSTKIKKLWAVDLEILKEFERVCKKYNIKYFADGGTLLGAVRHKGFVPWDDDIDIQVFADDYKKLCEIASEEFKEPYFWQTYETEVGFEPWHAKLRRSDTTGCTKCEIAGPPTLNKGIFIDIFPLYNIPDSKIKFKLQCLCLSFIRYILYGYRMLRSRRKSHSSFKSFLHLPIFLYAAARIFTSYNGICRIYTKISGWEKKNTSRIGVTSFAPGRENLIWARELFDDTTDLPFEDRMIKGPKRYDERLRVQYGDYMIIKKGAAQHTELTIDADTPYTDYDF